MIITIASDHAGFYLKRFIIENLESEGFAIDDLGCDSAENSVDYPDFANKLAEKIINKKSEFGILVCGSGVGVSISANRFREVRAALCSDVKTAELSRQHNDANIICLGARITAPKVALEAVKTFLATKFEGGRHEKRIAKLSN